MHARYINVDESTTAEQHVRISPMLYTVPFKFLSNKYKRMMTVFLLQLRIHLTFFGKSYAVLTHKLELQLKTLSQSFSFLNKPASQLHWEKTTKRPAFEQSKQENIEYGRQINQQNCSHESERKGSQQCLWLSAQSKEAQRQQQS